MNAYERGFSESVAETGFGALRAGWPDFAILDHDGGLYCVVELKSGKDPVSASQIAIHDALRRAGVRVVVLRSSQEMLSFLGELQAIGQHRDPAHRRLERAALSLPTFGPHTWEPVVNPS